MREFISFIYSFTTLQEPMGDGSVISYRTKYTKQSTSAATELQPSLNNIIPTVRNRNSNSVG